MNSLDVLWEREEEAELRSVLDRFVYLRQLAVYEGEIAEFMVMEELVC
jgi:hypothetical protein